MIIEITKQSVYEIQHKQKKLIFIRHFLPNLKHNVYHAKDHVVLIILTLLCSLNYNHISLNLNLYAKSRLLRKCMHIMHISGITALFQ